MLDAIKEGDPIPLNLQLFDGKTDRHVKANIVGPTGTSIAANVSMPHSGLGLYQSSAQLMPRVDYVAVTYIVYDEVDAEDLVYARSQDVFYRAKEQEPSELVGTVEDSNQIVGTVEDANELTGEVSE